VIQIFVSTGEALREVVDAMRSSLDTEHIVINCCTADPASVVAAGKVVRATGARFLDAPFTGSKNAAAEGTLVYYVGGDARVLDWARPVLEASSREILHLGRVGEASVLKLATNMISAATIAVLAEAYGLVTAAGINPEKLEAAIAENASSSVLTAMKLPQMVAEDYDPHFSLKHMFKDAQYALSLAKVFEIQLPTLSATASVMYRSIQRGWGEQDFSVIANRYQGDPVPEEVPITSGDA
jgi:3-hydroxyisobutyrate dehydrogenase-like beta-hydroxyacid dehydrogenase